MRTYNEKLNSLTGYSVWLFTKQDTDFDESFKATKLFADIEDKQIVNIETYFANNHQKYDISTHRHRMLIIPQLYGLITKTPFFSKGGNYLKEVPTAIFELHKNDIVNSKEYNIFKTEQLLKIKIHAIIDTANNNENYNILPIVFIYQVLKELKEKYGINEITEEQLYTYVMTCKSYSELNEAVYFIKNNYPTSNFVNDYKSRSRVITFIKKNIKLFNISNGKISINPKFDDYFYNNFIKKHDIISLHEQLLRDVDYSYFLYNHQNFNINLIDEPICNCEDIVDKNIESRLDIEDEEDDAEYVEKVNSIDERNINENIAKDAFKIEPVLATKLNSKRFRTNPILGKIAITKSNYKCEVDANHTTFLSKTNNPYMEAHHFIPVCNQKYIWDKYQVNIDCIENLVSLCPTCHKAFHYGSNDVKSTIICKIYNKRVKGYNEIGLNISEKEILKLYKVR